MSGALASAPRSRSRVKRAPFDPLLIGALILGAISVLAGLGASSLFVDEVYSWQAARLPLSEIHAKVLADEVAPDTYYLLQHAWIQIFGDDEWVMRVPSAAAAIALVGAIWWLTAAVADRRAAAVAAVLCAASPLVLQYGQQVRAYIFAMLAVTLAVGSAARCAAAAGAARRGWFVATLVCCVAAFWIHYTAGLVVLALLIWLLASRELLPGRERVAGVAIAALSCAVLVPQMTHQLDLHPAGIEGFARMTFRNVIGVVGAPFDGRVSPGLLLHTVAALICAAALVSTLARRGDAWSGARGVALLAAIPIVTVILRTLAGADVLISRYVAVSAPLVLVVLAVAVTRLRPGVRVPAVALLVAIALVGSVRSHLPEGRDSDVRALSAYVADRAAPGEALVVSDVVGLTVFSYYLPRALPPGFAAYTVRDTRLASTRGIWLVTRKGVDPNWSPEAFAALLKFPSAGGQRTFEGNAPYVLTHLSRR